MNVFNLGQGDLLHMQIFRNFSVHKIIASLIFTLFPLSSMAATSITAYFEEWGIYDINYHVSDIPADKLTHINYAFAKIGASGEIALYDPYAAVERYYAGDSYTQAYMGNFNQLKKLKARYPHLKVLISIGGWTLSKPFYSMAKTQAGRERFAASVLRFLQTYDFFDGVDVDWEYPVINGLDALGSPEDRDNFTLLMQALRQAIGNNYELTVAVSASKRGIDAIDYQSVHPYLNRINLMSYDLHGDWDTQTGHNSALYNNNDVFSSEFNMHSAVQNLIAAGVPKEKVVPGLAFYGRSFANVAGQGINQNFSGHGSSTGDDEGMLTYADIAANYKNKNGYKYYWDDIAKVPYLYNASRSEFISYDDPVSIKNKAQYAANNGLGGVMFWAMSNDNGELINAISEGLNTATDNSTGNTDSTGNTENNINSGGTSSSGNTTNTGDTSHTGSSSDIANSTENVDRIKRIINATTWNTFFPMANAIYSYDEFLIAVAKFPALCGDSDALCRKELATIFAHMTQETGYHDNSSSIPEWQQGLYYIREIGCEGDGGTGCGDYRSYCTVGTWVTFAYPCFSGQNYYGRGAKQLSYNFNYGLFSRFVFDDATVLLKQPDRVAQEGWLAISSAIWFYMMPQPPKPSIHDVVTGKWQPNSADLAANIQAGFGATTNIINGAMECGSGSESNQSQSRMQYYQSFSQALGIEAGDNIGCASQRAFPDNSAGAQKIYWDKAWSGEESCQLVDWQTPFLTFFKEDYARCVTYHFGTSPYACGDGIDNDGDGYIDLLDPDCSDLNDTDEANSSTDNSNTTNTGSDATNSGETTDTSGTTTGNATDTNSNNTGTVSNDNYPEWSGNSVAYALNDFVTYKSYLYKVVLAHTSAANWYPDQVWYFEQQAAIDDTDTSGNTSTNTDSTDTSSNTSTNTDSTISVWNGNATQYNLGDLISYKGFIYEVVLAHTSVPNWYPDQVWYFEQQ